MVSLHIGVVLYKNSPRDFARFLNALDIALQVAHERLTVCLHVVDNVQAGEFSEAYRELLTTAINGPRIRWHEGHGNVGFGRAHNRLMDAAFSDDADYYLCVNPDGFIHYRALERLAVSVVSENRCLYEFRQMPSEHPKYYDEATGETEWSSGACMVISRTLHDTIGGFDEGFFMYCEDVDLSWRAKLDGYTCRIISNSYFFHDVMSRGFSAVREKQMLVAARYLAHKWGAEDFKNSMEAVLVAKGYIEKQSTLPRLASASRLFDTPPEQVVRFDNMLNFAGTRWEL